MRTLWLKWIVVALIILALFQYWYFGTTNCDACEFDDLSANKFYDLYVDECINDIEYINTLPPLNLTVRELKQYMENLSYKDETN